MTFIVELEPEVWLAEMKGDPGRTLVEDSAQQFDSIEDAHIALDAARKFRKFEDAVVIDTTVFG